MHLDHEYEIFEIFWVYIHICFDLRANRLMTVVITFNCSSSYLPAKRIMNKSMS